MPPAPSSTDPACKGPSPRHGPAEAVEVYRRLAAANPAAFEPNLSTALNNLGTRWPELGRRDAGLAATVEAVDVYRAAGRGQPGRIQTRPRHGAERPRRRPFGPGPAGGGRVGHGRGGPGVPAAGRSQPRP